MQHYIGEVGKRFSKRNIDHSGRNDKSHLYEHAEKTGHENMNMDHFQILKTNSKENLWRHSILNMKDPF